MKKLGSILALIALMFCSVSGAALYTVGGPIVNPSNGHSYYLVSQGHWTEAEPFAQSIGGHLATINDAVEDAWIYANVLNSDHAWIGLIYSPGPATWGWTDGDPAAYRNWAPGEPNFLEEPHYYGLLLGSSALPGYPTHWNNAPDSDNYYAVVEVVPEPSTFSLCAIFGLGGFIMRSRKSGSAASSQS